MTKGTSVNENMCICMRQHLCLYFLQSSPRVDLGFHNTLGVLFPNTQ